MNCKSGSSSRNYPSPTKRANMSRRELLKGALALSGLTACSDVTLKVDRNRAAVDHFTDADANASRRENERPGTREWMLQNTRVDPVSKYRCPWIEGYSSRTSVRT